MVFPSTLAETSYDQSCRLPVDVLHDDLSVEPIELRLEPLVEEHLSVSEPFAQ